MSEYSSHIAMCVYKNHCQFTRCFVLSLFREITSALLKTMEATMHMQCVLLKSQVYVAISYASKRQSQECLVLRYPRSSYSGI